MNATQRWELVDMVRRYRACGFTAGQIRRAISALAPDMAPPLTRSDVETFLEDHGLSDE